MGHTVLWRNNRFYYVFLPFENCSQIIHITIGLLIPRLYSYFILSFCPFFLFSSLCTHNSMVAPMHNLMIDVCQLFLSPLISFLHWPPKLHTEEDATNREETFYSTRLAICQSWIQNYHVFSLSLLFFGFGWRIRSRIQSNIYQPQSAVKSGSVYGSVKYLTMMWLLQNPT